EFGAVEARADLVETEAELSQRLDLLQTLELRGSIESMLGLRVGPRREQSDFVVVVQRAHRQTGALGYLADLHSLPVHGHPLALRPERDHPSTVTPHVA